MKSILCLAGSLVVGSLAVAPAAHAGVSDNQPYGQLFLGAQVGGEFEDETNTFADVDVDNGVAVGGALGYGWAGPQGGALRTEGEISYRRGQVAGLDADNLTFFGNAWLDLPVNEDVVPYVGGGAGYGTVGVEDGDTEGGFAYQVGGGVNLRVIQDAFVGVNYRYLVNNFNTEGLDANYSAHQVTASIGIPLN